MDVLITFHFYILKVAFVKLYYRGREKLHNYSCFFSVDIFYVALEYLPHGDLRGYISTDGSLPVSLG